MKRGMSKFFSALLVLCMLISMVPMAVFAAAPSTLYLKPNSNWKNDGARFAAYFFGGSGDAWASMTDSDGDGIYECAVPNGYTSVIFCRMNGGNSTNSWDNKWNQTSDLAIPTDGTNCYSVAEGTWDAGGGSWSTVSTEPVQVDYYLFGYINGANYGCEEDAANLGSYKFSDGTLTATFSVESYVGVKTSDNANWYMTEGFLGTAKTATLYNTNSGIAQPDKLYIPAGIKVTFTLTENSNGTLTLKYTTTASSCQHLFYTDGVCNACGSSCSHSWSNSVCTKCGISCTHSYTSKVTTAATCTTSGVKTYTCSTCKDSYTETIAATGHSYSNGKCSVCGTVDPNCSHSYTSKVTTAATCTKAGVKTYTCSKCGDVYTESIAATGHSYTSKVTTAATCSKEGVKTYTCSKCSNSYTEAIATIDHSYSNGSCTVCGASDPGYVAAYYLVGWINGANHGCEEDSANMGSYKFTSGKLTTTFTQDSYVFLKTEGNASWFLTESYTEATSATFVTGGTEKMKVPGGVQVTFTLTVNSASSVTLKYTTSSSSCTHLSHNQLGQCTVCGTTVSHTWSSGKCSVCGFTCSHTSHDQNGVCGTCGSAVNHSFSGNTCTVCGKVTASETVKIHFVDACVWQNVTAYIWKSSSSGDTSLNSWPGEILNKDANGYFTIDLAYKPVSGESIGLIFTNFNGGQTTDVILDYSTLSSGEVWVKPNNWTNGDGKYECYVTTTESTMVLSPEIHGTSVTFRYENSSASKVYVAGSMNSWSTSANKMTKDSSGVWTTTMTLSEGVYEYKFVVDGEWILDPKNGLIGGYDNNSLVIVGNAGSASNTDITVKFHFYRESGDYTNWDVWMWGATNSGQGCTLSNDSTYKGKTATFTIPGGTNAYVNYKVRKTDWSDEEFYERSIDLSNIASGTVHFFLNSGSATGSIVYGNDVIKMGKPTYANLDYNSGNIWVKTPLPVSGDFTKAFSVVKSDGSASGISVTGVTMDNNGYSLTLSRKPALIELHELVVKCGTVVSIKTDGLFYSSGFANDYTYYGNDLGATWSKKSTTFKVWAPTATGVSVILYGGGNHGGDDWISTTPMTLGEKGVYTVTISGDLNGTYYNYLVNFPTYTTEATDPYAKTTGANGDRGMIIDMDSANPEGWENDISPNKGLNYTDAIIYEMHIREMTIDSSSGVKDEWKGKYLGLTQTGTNYQGRATALDHLKELGITHVQLMPTYDHAGVDEYHLTDWQQYAWGYNPKNFNVPEGSFATDPFNGEVRVTEMKQMVQAFHSNGINVVMDVVYNHTFSGGDFCYNKIVPNYFSRFWGENNWSNGSGVGNDFATERSMGRNYIVDSILYWVEEYHIDGFRFDLAGLIDIQTMNEAISTVQAKYPYVIFYGEGWTVGGTAIQDGHWTATKENAWQTGSLAFYNDSFRNDIAGDNGNSWGFATGDSGKADAIGSYFRGSNGWSSSPSQSINYVSCHDNYTLIDKIIISRNGAYWDQMVKMNNMSAAIYMLSQGIPYIYSGEELLREKKDEWGNRYHNTYDSSDYITKIRWSDLVDKEYAQVTDDYYAGLVNFRKNHAALRCPGGGDAWGYTSYHKINDHCILFYVSGYPNYECSDGIVIIFNANEGTQWLNIYDYGVPYGYWQATVHGMTAGVNPLWGTSDGSVGVEGLSTTVLVLGDLIHEESVYNNQSYTCSHSYHNQSGLCWDCGASVSHNFVNGYCNHCNLAQGNSGNMTIYYDNSASQWGNVYAYAWTEVGGRTVTYTEGWPGDQMTHVGNNVYAVTVPCAATNIIFTDNYGNQTVTQGLIKNDTGTLTSNLYYSDSASWGTYQASCSHTSHNSDGLCTNCGVQVGHDWVSGKCSGCNSTCSHTSHTANGVCNNCGANVGHSWNNGNCTVCKKVCSHSWSNGQCTVCAMNCSHDYHDQNGTCYTCGYSVGHSYYGGLCSHCGAYKQGYIESQTYYLYGFINGADHGVGDATSSYKFTDGTLTTTFTSDSYVAVKTGDNCSFYMTDGYLSGVTSATLYDSRKLSAGDKLMIPGGKKVTFTLNVNSSNNTMVLSFEYADSSCAHSYTGRVTTAATCTATGVQTFTCSKCGDSYTQTIAKLDHSYTSQVTTAATCTTAGVKTFTCSSCGGSYTEAIAATGHSFENGKCTVCGAPDPSYAVTDTGYVQVTDVSQITAGGTFVIAAGTQAMGTTLSSGKFAPVAITIDGLKVTTENPPVWTITPVSGGITISLDGQYLAYNSSTNFKMSDTAYVWTVTEGSNGGYLLHSSATTRGVYYSNTAAKFGAYSTTYVNSTNYTSNLQLYKYQVGTQGCSHSYSSTITTAAGCTTNGVRTYTCSLCGDTYTEAIAATGHKYSGTTCTVCGATNPNVSGQGGYYLFGWINGGNYGCEDDYANLGAYQFVNGKLTATFTADSYVGIKTGDNANWYMTDVFVEHNAAIFYNTTGGVSEKMFVPGNVEVTFTLTENANGTLTLSYETASASGCQHRYSATVVTAATCKDYAVYGLTCSTCGEYKTLNASELANTWLYSVPTGMSSSNFTSSTVYRYRDNTTGGWTTQSSRQICYVIDWPSGYDTSHETYAAYNNIGKKVTAFENSAAKLTVDSDDIVGYLYYHWCYDGYPYSVANKSGNYNRFHAYFSNKTPDQADKHDASDNSYRFDDSTACDDCLWYFAVPVYSQVSTGYTANIGWGSWSDWSTSSVSSSTTREIETAKMYRFNAAALGDHSYANGYCTVCGGKDPSSTSSRNYYLFGYINGANYACEEDYENMGTYQFVNGKLTTTFDTDSYVGVKAEGNAAWYMTDGWMGTDLTSVTLYDTGLLFTADKFYVPGGVTVTFTLVENSDGTLTLSYTTGSSTPSTAPTVAMKYPSVSFEDVIIMNVYYTATDIQDVAEMGLITYTSKPTEGNVATADHVVPGYFWSDADSLYYSSTAGIAPKDIGDTLYFGVYWKLKDGTYGYTKVIGYSPKTYAVNQLSTGSAEMKPLVVAMLNYGAAAQTYFDYNTGSLMNSTLTTAQQAMVAAYSSSMISSVSQASGTKLGTFVNDSTYTKRYPTISFEGAFCINYYFAPSLAVKGDVTMYVWSLEDYNAASVLTKENATKAIKMELAANGEYTAVIDGIAAKDLDKAIYVSFVYSDGTTEHCGGVIGYTIGMYCKSQASSTGNLAELAKACAVYGYYAKQLFG